MNECVNYALKNLIKQNRPAESERKEYGMPSSHSQFMAFWMFYWWSSLNSMQKFLSALVTMLVLYGRIHLIYHTTNQVLIGVSIGIAMGFLYKKLIARLQ